MEELKQYYGIVMEIESTYGNNTHKLRNHHQQIKAKFPKIMGIDRFERIRRALTPTILELQQLSNMLGDIFKGYKPQSSSLIEQTC